MPRTKLRKFQEIEEMKNILEPSKEIYQKTKGNWSQIFENKNPLVVELACGYGNYTNGLAQVFENKNFLGVDIKGERVWKGAKDAESLGLDNSKFLRCPIEIIEKFFAAKEIDEIWITFPDPRDKNLNKRLTSDKFLDIYKTILAKNGILHLKTDSDSLFEWTLKVLEKRSDIQDLQFTRDFYNSDFVADSYGIKTGYEQKYLALGVDIKYLQFKFVQ